MCIAGTCRTVCDPTLEDPCDNGPCLYKPGSTLSICLETCEPALEGCSGSDSCYLTGSGYACLDPEGAQTMDVSPCDGDTCEPDELCVPAQSVAACESSECCARACSLSAPDCADGLECVAFWSSPLPGHEDDGLCLIP